MTINKEDIKDLPEKEKKTMKVLGGLIAVASVVVGSYIYTKGYNKGVKVGAIVGFEKND